MTTYDNVVRAAERLLTDDTKDTWALSDAVAAHVPEDQRGGDRRSDHLPRAGQKVPEQLADLAQRMQQDGITTPSGDHYTADSLRHLRNTSVSWPQNERHSEAAFSTHREATSPNTEAGKVLKALTAVARGEKVTRPRGLDLRSWDEAVRRVQARKKGFKVAANDLNVALDRRTNGSRKPKVTKTAIADAIAKGDVTPDEVLDAIPDKETAEEFREERRRKIRQSVAQGEEGMTDEELRESDEELGGLLGAIGALDQTGKQLEDAALGSSMLQAIKELERTAVFTLMMTRRHQLRDDAEQTIATASLDTTTHSADMVRMAIGGFTFTPEDQKFLQAVARGLEEAG